jgi:hypothetical protein
MKQLSLSFASGEEDLRERLETSLRRPVHLVLTDNHVSMIRVRTDHDGVRLRLHRIFLDAGDDVLREVARFARTRKNPGPLIGDFIRGRLRDRPEPAARSVRIEPQGRHFNLQAVFDRLNPIYFSPYPSPGAGERHPAASGAGSWEATAAVPEPSASIRGWTGRRFPSMYWSTWSITRCFMPRWGRR